VISKETDDVVRATESKYSLDDLPRLRPSVDEIPEKDERAPRPKRKLAEELVERLNASVDVADGEDGPTPYPAGLPGLSMLAPVEHFLSR
jgi:hypothetical protein